MCKKCTSLKQAIYDFWSNATALYEVGSDIKPTERLIIKKLADEAARVLADDPQYVSQINRKLDPICTTYSVAELE